MPTRWEEAREGSSGHTLHGHAPSTAQYSPAEPGAGMPEQAWERPCGVRSHHAQARLCLRTIRRRPPVTKRAQPIAVPSEHKMAFELPTSNFLLFLEYTQCNAVCLSAMRHKGTAILWLNWTRTKMPGSAAFPSPFTGNWGFLSTTETRRGCPLLSSAAREGIFCLTSSFPAPPAPQSSFVCNCIFIKWLPRKTRVFCSAKAAAHTAEHSASVRWPLSKKNAISDPRLPALWIENRLRSNPPQPFPPPQKNDGLVLEKPRAGYRCKGLFSPAASVEKPFPHQDI